MRARSAGRAGGGVEAGAAGPCSAGSGSAHVCTDCGDRHSRTECCLTHHHSYTTIEDKLGSNRSYDNHLKKA